MGWGSEVTERVPLLLAWPFRVGGIESWRGIEGEPSRREKQPKERSTEEKATAEGWGGGEGTAMPS